MLVSHRPLVARAFHGIPKNIGCRNRMDAIRIVRDACWLAPSTDRCSGPAGPWRDRPRVCYSPRRDMRRRSRQSHAAIASLSVRECRLDGARDLPRSSRLAPRADTLDIRRHASARQDQHLADASAGGLVARSKTLEAVSHTSTSAFSLVRASAIASWPMNSAPRPRDEFRLRVEFFSWGSAGPTRGETVSMSNDDHESWRDCGVRSNGMPAAAGDRIVDLDVSWLVPADLGAVDALARLQIAASRCGWWLQFHGANGGLVELVEFVGLGEVVHLCPHCRPA